jgi:hypothetical protein
LTLNHLSKRRRGTNKHVERKVVIRVRDAAQDAWLVGLNVIAKAQDDANRLLEKAIANPALSRGSEKLLNGVAHVGRIFQASADTLLGRVGVASRRDIEVLSRRVSKLARELEKLSLVRNAPAAASRSAPRTVSAEAQV